MKAKNLALAALFAALTAVCAWVSLPIGDMNFTLQSFAIALTLLLLGGKWGSVAIFVYLLLGAVGLPVFSGFRSGAAMLFGATGGYLFGFLLWALGYWLITAIFGSNAMLPALISGQLLCYACGALWMLFLYFGERGLGAALAASVLPYLLPDSIKIYLAWLLAKRLRRQIS